MSYRSNEEPASNLAKVVEVILMLWLVFLFLLVLPALFKISVSVNKFLLKFGDQGSQGNISREEGLALSLAGVAWGLIFLLFLPLTIDLELDSTRSLWILLAAGVVWGLGTMYQALYEYQEEILALRKEQLISNFTEALDLPGGFYQSAGNNGQNQAVLTPEEPDGLILGVEWPSDKS